MVYLLQIPKSQKHFLSRRNKESTEVASVITAMWTSETEASEPQLAREAAGHLRANGGSADQGLCSWQGDEWWLQSKCQNYKFHPTLTQSSSKVYLHFHVASKLERQCQKDLKAGWISDCSANALKHASQAKFISLRHVVCERRWGADWKNLSLTCLSLLLAPSLAFDSIQLSWVEPGAVSKPLLKHCFVPSITNTNEWILLPKKKEEKESEARHIFLYVENK